MINFESKVQKIINVQVGPRATKDRERFPPNNILLMLAGAGLLWMGWTGFNGGDPYNAGIDASLAVLNTHVCTATSLLTWLILDILFFGKPSVIGATQGMITGLVCITPAAGTRTINFTNILSHYFISDKLSTPSFVKYSRSLIVIRTSDGDIN